MASKSKSRSNGKDKQVSPEQSSRKSSTGEKDEAKVFPLAHEVQPSEALLKQVVPKVKKTAVPYVGAEDNAGSSADESVAESDGAARVSTRKRKLSKWITAYVDPTLPAKKLAKVDEGDESEDAAKPATGKKTARSRSPSLTSKNPPVSFENVGEDGNRYNCSKCFFAGEVICCDGCPNVFHKRCLPTASRNELEEQSQQNPDDPWFCPQCVAENNPNARKRKNSGPQGRLSAAMKGTVRKDASEQPIKTKKKKQDKERQRMLRDKRKQRVLLSHDQQDSDNDNDEYEGESDIGDEYIEDDDDDAAQEPVYEDAAERKRAVTSSRHHLVAPSRTVSSYNEPRPVRSSPSRHAGASHKPTLRPKSSLPKTSGDLNAFAQTRLWNLKHIQPVDSQADGSYGLDSSQKRGGAMRCYHCRQTPVKAVMQCPEASWVSLHTFCLACLKDRHGIDKKELFSGKVRWVCPICRDRASSLKSRKQATVANTGSEN